MARPRSLGRVAPARVAAAGVALALVLLGSLPGLVDGKVLTWSISADRSSVEAGLPTVVTLTITSPLVNVTLVNCVVVSIPTVYTLGSTSYTDSRGSSYQWTVSTSSGSLTIKDANDNDGLGGLLAVSTLVVKVAVTGQTVGVANWTALSYDRNDCKHDPSPAPTIAMQITGTSPTPTPAPSPTRTPSPTPTPTPVPSATPSPSPIRTPSPSASPTPSPTPIATSRPSASVPPTGSGGGGGGSAGGSGFGGGSPSGAGPGHGGTTGLTVVTPGSGPTLNISTADFASGLGAFSWTVPGFLLGLPGLLVLVILGLQVSGVALFVPLSRRILGRPDPRRRPRRG